MLDDLDQGLEQQSKRTKVEEDGSTGNLDGSGRATEERALVPHSHQALISSVNYHNSSLIVHHQSNHRTSSLPAPELTLTGHEGAVYGIAFDPQGQHLASAGLDRKIFLWDLFPKSGAESEGCVNYNVLSGHKNAILQLLWSNANQLITCSADRTIALWDSQQGTRIRKYHEHSDIVNAVACDGEGKVIASASDDCSTILWDVRSKTSVASAFLDYQQLAVALSKDGQHVYTAGIDNIVRRYDTRKGLSVMDWQLEGPEDSVTGLQLSPDGCQLLVNAMDAKLRIFDVRPMANSGVGMEGRQRAVLTGGRHGAEKLLLRCAWAPDGDLISAGSADRLVHIWDGSHHYRELGAWEGHKASVNEVIFHPTQAVLASASSDKTITVAEIVLP